MLYVVGDIHFGMRKNNKVFHKIVITEFEKLISKVTNEDSVVFLGDIFDSRSSIDFNILNVVWDLFIELSRKVKEIFILVGNHDLYYKETKPEYVNCRFLRFEPGSDSKIAPIYIIDKITKAKIQNHICLFVPWIDCKEQKQKSIDAMTNDLDFIFGHFDIVGLYGRDEIDERTMLDNDELPNRPKILSGHYHYRGPRGKILYVGSLISFTFNDVDNEKGIYRIKEDKSIEFMKGNSPKFHIINVEDPKKFIYALENSNKKSLKQLKSKIEGNIIRLIVNEYSTENTKLYNLIKGMSPLELTINYNRFSLDSGDEGEGFEGFNSQSDIQEIIASFIDHIEDQLPNNINTQDIKNIINKKHKKYVLDIEKSN